ncbi:MAG TPA: type III secretion system chaperone [Noviherbaspirillum sp.]
MNMHEIVAEIGQRVGIPDFSLDSEGHAAFVTDQDLHIELHATDDRVRLKFNAVIGKLREDRAAQLMLDLLSTNAAATGVCAPFFAFHTSTREVVLSASFPVDLLPLEAAPDVLILLIERANAERARLANCNLQVF